MVAASDADILYTDVWVSMGCEEEADEKRIMSPYQVTDSILASAKADAFSWVVCPLILVKKFQNLFSLSPPSFLIKRKIVCIFRRQSFVNSLNPELIILIHP